MTYPAAIFDLDGALADTLRDLADATNWGLAELGQPTHPVQAYRLMVGEGRNVLCQRALPSDRQDLTPRLEELMTRYYGEHCFDFTAPYPGIEELLKALQAANIRMAVLSNKPQPFVDLTIEKLFGAFRFDAVCGEGAGIARKPDPAGALAIAEKLDLPPATIAYVGDTWIDMETAVKAGMFAIGVTWGFRDRRELEDSGAQAIVDTPADLARLLLGGR